MFLLQSGLAGYQAGVDSHGKSHAAVAGPVHCVCQGLAGPDPEIVVYPGILVPRIYLNLQNIFKEFSV